MTERWYAWEDARKLARQNEPELVQEEIFRQHEDDPELAREKITQIYGRGTDEAESPGQTEEEASESKQPGAYNLTQLQSEIDEMAKGKSVGKSGSNA